MYLCICAITLILLPPYPALSHTIIYMCATTSILLYICAITHKAQRSNTQARHSTTPQNTYKSKHRHIATTEHSTTLQNTYKSKRPQSTNLVHNWISQHHRAQLSKASTYKSTTLHNSQHPQSTAQFYKTHTNASTYKSTTLHNSQHTHNTIQKQAHTKAQMLTTLLRSVVSTMLSTKLMLINWNIKYHWWHAIHHIMIINNNAEALDTW